MIEVNKATLDDVNEFISLQSALFDEDAGVHDPFSDVTWQLREGRRDFESLIDSPESLVLIATSVMSPVGLVVGYDRLGLSERSISRVNTVGTAGGSANGNR